MTMQTSTADLEALLDALTLEEQVALLAGADFWTTVAIPRVGVPPLKVSDGPAGARGGGTLVGGRPTAAFPVGIALGASWNVALVQEVGEHLAREALGKGAGVLLAPTINLFRSSVNGRNFEAYSEDPRLTGALAVAYVRGLQSRGVAATVKHFVGNESEFERGTISSDIPERALRELYLRPFEMAVKDGGAWAVMSAYNKLNGTYCSEDPRLLTDILRRGWGFDGLVMSDWGGTHSAGESVRAGLDLEMPGPARARAGLLQEAREDDATRRAVRAAAGNVLRLIARTGTLDAPRDVSVEAERADEDPSTRALIRRAGAEGMVLLKNDGGLLPLPEGASVAVIGPNGAQARIMGGGSAQMHAHRAVSPLQGLTEALGEARVTFAVGCDNDRFLPVLDAPLHVTYRAPGDAATLAEETHPGGEKMWFGLPDGVPRDFAATLSAEVSVPEDDRYALSLISAGRSRLHVDGEVVLDNWSDWAPGHTYFGFGSDERRVTLPLTRGVHRLEVEFEPADHENGTASLRAVRMGFARPLPEGSVQEAADIAARADYAVVCVGTNGDWETEGVDRWGLDLPGRQNELVRAVRAANPRTVVLLQTGGPVLTPWLDEVPAVLQAWFPGQEAGHAVADVLLGRAEPSGRLPQTFPARLADDPTRPDVPDLQYPGEGGHVAYREGLFIGYRHVDRAGTTPLFPFGFGLSYTRFALSDLRVPETVQPGAPFHATVRVRNTGERAGQTVVQLYLHDDAASVERPEKELVAFTKVTLEPGDERTVTLPLDMRSLAFFDDARQTWRAEAGDFTLLAGESSASLPLRVAFRLSQEWTEPA